MKRVTDVDRAKTFEILEVMMQVLADSPYHDYIVLSGASALMQKVRDLGCVEYLRYTHDIDLTILDEKTYHGIFDEVCDLLNTNTDGVMFTLIKHRGYNVDYKSDSVTLEAVRGDYNVSVKIDMNIKPILNISIDNDFNFPLRTYNFYAVLSDKLSVVLSPKIHRRIKDMYDVYIIASIVDLSMSKLLSGISFKRPDLIYEYEYMFTTEGVESLYKTYSKFAGVNPNITFNMILPVVDAFVRGFISTVSGEEVFSRWSCTGLKWLP